MHIFGAFVAGMLYDALVAIENGLLRDRVHFANHVASFLVIRGWVQHPLELTLWILHAFVGALAALRHPVNRKVNEVRPFHLVVSRDLCRGERAQAYELSAKQVAQVRVEADAISALVGPHALLFE